MVNSKNMIDYIMDYECGTLNQTDSIELFSHLIKTGQAWSLQGHYGRTAKHLIVNDYIDKDGVINWDFINDYD